MPAPSARRTVMALAGVVALGVSACGSDEDLTGEATSPTVVVTATILGDVVEELVGDQAEVTTVMKVGTDPHVFQASAQEVNQIREADALIVNGAGHEEGLIDVIEAAESDGVPTYEAISAVTDTLEFGSGDHDDGDEAEQDEAHDGDDRVHEGVDPHFFHDPTRMIEAVEGMSAFLADTVPELDATALDAATADYVAELEIVDEEAEMEIVVLAHEQRKLITNHDALAYFADRYEFEVIGTVIPGGSTSDGASAGELAALATVVEEEAIPAVFADATASDNLARTLADEASLDVDVVALYTGSLGEADSGAATYLTMIRENVARIVDALG